MSVPLKPKPMPPVYRKGKSCEKLKGRKAAWERHRYLAIADWFICIFYKTFSAGRSIHTYIHTYSIMIMTQTLSRWCGVNLRCFSFFVFRFFSFSFFCRPAQSPKVLWKVLWELPRLNVCCAGNLFKFSHWDHVWWSWKIIGGRRREIKKLRNSWFSRQGSAIVIHVFGHFLGQPV